ncbi:exopolysaccharide transport family protein [Paludisphaera borealis]|uniref:Tyrosine-protein kinase wzc n=1 Tax=Paludisphaera borealis TaxID=1387353 RepID=A0A1U7CZ81_9BACT|nr:polysaccharide biosynthesis tyrosine autokinase [Paludisphaera borealis]APW64244.1 Tyrosine-protein kinase wzc [Paludisphaera borealis]
MDTTDSNDSLLPARLPSSSSSHLPAMSAANRHAYDLTTVSSSVQISPQGVLRGLARNWWRILLLWAVVSAPLDYLIYSQIQPTYEAVSTIRAEPTQLSLYGQQNSNAQAQPIERFIGTQIAFITTNTVLKPAIGDSTVAELPFIKNSTDKLTDLRQKLKVKNKDGTVHIQVSFDSTDAHEAAAIVNAVVASYLRSYKDVQQSRDESHLKRLTVYLDRLKKDKEEKVEALKEIVERGNVNGQSAGESKPKESTKTQGSDPAPQTKDASIEKFSIEQYRNFKADILKKKLELNELEFALQKRVADSQEQDSEVAETTGFQKSQLEARINETFRRDPSVASLIQQILETDEELAHTVGVARKGYDPARQAAEKRKAQLMAKYNSLWDERYGEIRQLVMAEDASFAASAAAAGSGTVATNALTIEALRARVELSRHQLDTLNQLVLSMEIERKATQSDTYAAERLKADIETLVEQYKHISEKFENLKFAGTTDVDVGLIDAAIAVSEPTNNKRIKYVVIVPSVILCLVLGLFALLEVKAERVADPDALSTRVQSEVFSLPPLPMVRASNKLNGPAEDDQIDRFIQRLDHLRFAVCGDHPEVGLGRCVLITSAIGGEGKTTLAAQLAARCGHAGHSTLLIDADLRRGSLCSLLDIPEGLGLSDVLKEEANVEDVAIPVQGGTFHLLCAGTPVADTSRLFQGRNFGMMIARLRQMYDLIIIDSPPVLPVPDGLIMGRWTDGAVLASRYDISRAPQVERARRQLTNAGIPVLGTVINGMKSSDAYYGRYSYSRGRSGYGEPDASPTT